MKDITNVDVPWDLILNLESKNSDEIIEYYKRQIINIDQLMNFHLSKDEGHYAQFCQDQIDAFEEAINSVKYNWLKWALD